MTPSDYLKKPYARILSPDVEIGGFTAKILEFPGCVAEGATAEEAYRNLEAAAESWLIAALDTGYPVSEPLVASGYSGRIALRLPKSLHEQVVRLAEFDGVSVNQFLVAAIAEKAGQTAASHAAIATLDARLSEIRQLDILRTASTFEATTLATDSINKARIDDPRMLQPRASSATSQAGVITRHFGTHGEPRARA